MLTLHHIGITTRNLRRLEAFYRDHFGAQVVRRGGWPGGQQGFDQCMGLHDSAVRIVLLRCGAAHLELFEFTRPQTLPAAEASVAREGLTHLAFQVSDCRAEYARLSAAGMRFNAQPLLTPVGAWFTYGHDPDGNIVELIQPPPGD